MSKQDIIFKLIEMLIACDDNQQRASARHVLNGKPVIVRARDAGVHFGYLDTVNGRTVTLKKSRRMYRWWAAKQMTLSAVAEFGLNLNKDLKIQNELDYIEILDACEIIPASQICVESFSKVEPYNEQ